MTYKEGIETTSLSHFAWTPLAAELHTPWGTAIDAPFRFCDKWMRRQAQVPDEEPRTFAAQAAHRELVRPFGFAAYIPLVAEQCEAVFNSLQPALESYSYTDFEGPAEMVWVRAAKARTLRAMKLDTVANTRRVEASTLRTLLKMSTGTGKTLTSLALLCHMLGEAGLEKTKPVVVIVPTELLAKQVSSSCLVDVVFCLFDVVFCLIDVVVLLVVLIKSCIAWLMSSHVWLFDIVHF
jgi:hypothetical protein